MRKEIQNKLCSLSEEKYREFSKRLIPTLKREILGVRIPALRTIAKQIAKMQADDYLKIENDLLLKK